MLYSYILGFKDVPLTALQVGWVVVLRPEAMGWVVAL